MDFLENIKSINWVNIATYSSIFLTLFIFFYQEFSSRIDGKKEVKRIVEEIVDLVIRNHASKKIGLTEVDLKVIIEGFENLKQIKLAIPTSGFLKMIYAKVYTNEHITTDIRKEILRDLDVQIIDSESNESITEMENKVIIDWRRKNEILSSIICILLLTFSYKYILIFEYLQNDKLLTFVLIFTLFIFVIYWLKPTLSGFLKGKTEKRLDAHLALVREANFEVKNNKFIKFNTAKKENAEVVALEPEPSKEVKTEETFTESKKNIDSKPLGKLEEEEIIPETHDPMSLFLPKTYTSEQKDLIRKILEQRFIFENMLKRIYLTVYDSNPSLPTIKMLNRLYNDGILDSGTFTDARDMVRIANIVAHSDGRAPSGFFESFQELLSRIYLIEHTLTNERIKRIKDAKNKQTEEN